MLSRTAAPTLERLKDYYPVVAVTGPRQAGKTTLARAVFPHKPYANLEEPDTREFAVADPRGFLARFPGGAVLDEVQRAPELLSYLQARVDEDRKAGHWILTGSQQLGLIGGISQSLAGRVGYLHLLPFSQEELSRLRKPSSLEAMLWTGGYPPIHDRGVPASVWLRDYVQTYVERDVRQLINVRDLGVFQRFVRMCAMRTGQTLNLSALAADCGVSHVTARGWLTVLEASYLAFTLPSWHRNLGKRLVKAPKLHFYDTGLAAWLAGVDGPATLGLSALRGPLFESWVVSEVMKHRFNHLHDAACHFFRDSNGNEVDLVVEFGGQTFAVEVKSGATLAGDWFRGLHRFAEAAGNIRPVLIYGGDETFEREGVSVFGWRSMPDWLRRLAPGPGTGARHHG
ncbi:MAG: ATP-binding protein [Betaproteobacteria bacterium]|nr:ATP-binding protein [Betaproteobacteria bacterium]